MRFNNKMCFRSGIRRSDWTDVDAGQLDGRGDGDDRLLRIVPGHAAQIRLRVHQHLVRRKNQRPSASWSHLPHSTFGSGHRWNGLGHQGYGRSTGEIFLSSSRPCLPLIKLKKLVGPCSRKVFLIFISITFVNCHCH